MAILWIFLPLLVFFLLLLGIYRLRERRYLKKKLSETVESQFYQEMTHEEDSARRRQEKFHNVLKKHQK